MKYYHKKYKEIDCGTTRVIKKFLFLPKKLKYVTRWLEWVHVRQVAFCGVIGKHGNWDDYEWVFDTSQILDSEKNLESR